MSLSRAISFVLLGMFVGAVCDAVAIKGMRTYLIACVVCAFMGFVFPERQE